MDETRAKKAWELDQTIKSNELQRRYLMVQNVKLLSEIQEKKYYKELLGFEDSQWAGYLADVEIFYSRSQVDSYLRVYRKLAVELGQDPELWIQYPLTRLSECLPLLNHDNVDDWLSKVATLTSRDFNIEVRKAKGKITEEDDHAHDMVSYDICKKCGKKEKHDHTHQTEE